MHLILHLGPPKTASTAIQRALWQGEEQLRAADCYHFRAPRPAEWALQFRYAAPAGPLPHALQRWFGTGAEARAWSEECWTGFERELTDRRPAVAILSSEHFANVARPGAFIARLSCLFDRITAVAYARDPVAVYVSDIAERIRGGWRFCDLPQVHGFHDAPMANVRRFEQLVGAANLMIRDFDPEVWVGGDIVADFFAVVSDRTGCRIASDRVRDSAANTSLCAAATVWLLAFNNVGPVQMPPRIVSDRDRIIAALAGAPDLQRLPRLEMTYPVLEQSLRWQADKTIRWLNARHLKRPFTRAAAPPLQQTPSQLRDRLRNWLENAACPLSLEAVNRVVAETGLAQTSRTCVPTCTSS